MDNEPRVRPPNRIVWAALMDKSNGRLTGIGTDLAEINEEEWVEMDE